MKLELIRHTWGTTGTWEELFPAFRADGYHGVETAPPAEHDRNRLAELLEKLDFTLILQIASRGTTVEEHLDTFERNLHTACASNPRIINAHSGRDSWTDDEAARFFSRTLELEQACGIPVVHETHRSRILYNPWTSARMLDLFPTLKLCCDFSHWVCVSESLLDDQQAVLRLAAQRCHHLHARVGHEQGPQVSDPSAPEYAAHLAAHEAWWRMIWDIQLERGDTVTTLVPEFGPPPYAPTLPGTSTPLRNVKEVCNWMARRELDQYIRHTAQS